MKKQLHTVLSVGLFGSVPTTTTGTHFVGKVTALSNRKEATISCIKDQDKTFRLLLNAEAKQILKSNSVHPECFVLLEEKGVSGSTLVKLKDIAPIQKWKENETYETQLAESIPIEIMPIQNAVTA